jgi:glycosyltransferase involved in cell wall biosynthesis
MRLLEVLPTYPGDLYDGSAVYYRALNAALLERGVEIEVLCTRARRLRHRHEFSITWPNELPSREVHAGVRVRRFRTINSDRLGQLASDAVSRRWSREDAASGEIVPGSAGFVDAAIDEARRRPRRFDLLADLGRGPLAPHLIAHLRKWVPLYDVVLVGYTPFSLQRQVLWAAGGLGVPIVLLPFIHENDRYHHFGSQLDTYERAAAVLTLSPHTSDLLRKHAPRSSPVTLGAGVTTGGGSGEGGTEFRSRHGLGDRPMLLFVGRKEKGKQYELAVDAVEMLGEDAVLVMIGRDVDHTVIRSKRVCQLGTVSDEELGAAYEACDVFVFPSALESFGMVVLDAWVRGKPVIGNPLSGATSALIEDGVDGFLCGTSGEIAAVVEQLLAQPALRERIGSAGRAKTLREYTWARVADRALEAFAEIVAHRRPADRSRPASSSQSDKRVAVNVPADARPEAPGRVAPRRWDPIFYPHWEPAIPDRSLWPGPDDSVAHFLRWPFEYLAYLTLLCGLKRQDAVLELGCNHGRTMLTLLDYLQPPGRYEGLDILGAQIAFARDHIEKRAPHFRFTLADIYNDAYNPTGSLDAASYRFPYEDASFDCSYAASLFTHLLPDAAASYLRETRRVMKAGRSCLYSFFVLDFYQGKGTSADPLYEFDGRIANLPGVGVHNVAAPGAVIAYERKLIEQLASDAGMRVSRIVPGFWSRHGDYAVNEQDLVLLEAA